MNLWNDEVDKIEGIHVMAEYNEQVVPENIGNPFIEAIPIRLNVEGFYDALYSVPSFDTEQLKLNVEDRLDLIQQIRPSFWLPFPSHYDKYRNLYNMIKIGYQSRNPMLPMYNRQFAIGWDKILKEGINKDGANLAGNIQTAQSLAEIGLSGMGKSKAYERILSSLFPKVIHHSEYKGKPLALTQVVWLKVECPSGQSVGALCMNFYAEVDKILGSNFYEKHGERAGNIDKMAMRMAKVVSQINLGVLIIDEIQNVHKAHSGGDQRMINFITGLVNSLGIPVILIGTFKAMYLFRKSLANTRRAISDGYSENIMSYLTEDSWEWNEFFKSLWDLQYTRKFTPLTEEHKHAFYFHSLGIPDLAVKLFMHVQSRAVLNATNGVESITLPLINDVAKKSLYILRPIFDKVLRGDSKALEELEDVQPNWEPFNEYLKEAKHKVNIDGKLADVHWRANQKRMKTSLLDELFTFALNLVDNSEQAETLAYQVYNASNGMGEKQEMFSQLANMALNQNNNRIEKSGNKQKSNKSTKIKPDLEKTDIRYIVEKGKKSGLSTEESLEEANIIKDCFEILDLCR